MEEEFLFVLFKPESAITNHTLLTTFYEDDVDYVLSEITKHSCAISHSPCRVDIQTLSSHYKTSCWDQDIVDGLATCANICKNMINLFLGGIGIPSWIKEKCENC